MPSTLTPRFKTPSTHLNTINVRYIYLIAVLSQVYMISNPGLLFKALYHSTLKPLTMSIYRPLNAHRHEIRLLRLHPESSTGFDSPLKCDLLYSYLDDVQPYEALTYFWGDKDDLRPLSLDSHPMQITRNLDIALRHLRPQFSPTALPPARTLWVDALCINQTDTAERSHQVSLMKDVYSRCTRDLAWLGPLSDSDEFVPEWLSADRAYAPRAAYAVPADSAGRVRYSDHVRLGMDLMRRLRLRDLGDASLAGNPGLAEMEGGGGRHELDYRQVSALRAVFERPRIWGRVWVMQELSCAGEVRLVYGREEMEWGVVSRFLGSGAYADAWHMSMGHGSSTPFTRVIMGAVLAVEHQRGVMREVGEGKGYEAGLLDVLARFKGVRSTDPRDRVYGLLGLVTEKHGVRVDYGKGVGEVFAEVAVELIDRLGNLDIVCQNPWTKDTRTPELPSWVPDFADEVYASRDARTGFSRLLFAQRSIFSAGREKCDVPVKVQGENGRWKLRAKGAVIGKLGRVLHAECHDEQDGKTGTKYGSMHLSREWMLLYFGTELLDAPAESRQLERFWRTLAMDCEAYPISRLSEEVIEELKPDWEFHLRYDGPQDPEQAREEDREFLEPYTKYYKGRQMWLRNQEEWTFCLSDEGLYMMVRRGAKEGDTIAVLDGGKVPVILREVPGGEGRETEYQVVCVAYVHGFMDGEAVEMCEGGKLTQQEFCIA